MSVCFEFGVGMGESIKFNPSGGLAPSLNALSLIAKLHVGALEGEFGLKEDLSPCALAAPDFEKKVCSGSACTNGDLKFKPGVLKDFLNGDLTRLLGEEGEGVELKPTLSSSKQFKW